MDGYSLYTHPFKVIGAVRVNPVTAPFLFLLGYGLA